MPLFKLLICLFQTYFSITKASDMHDIGLCCQVYAIDASDIALQVIVKDHSFHLDPI